MQSEMLRKAREYEEETRRRVLDRLPAFHVTGGVGWINDPNGFSLYKGEYHLFFQYYPYDITWGPMHWGHVKTRDFIRWEQLPAALAPDREYDKDGCFSGSAVEFSGGEHLLLYTGVRKTDEGDEYQTQCIAVGDGTDYEKSPLNPVIDSSMLPDGGSHVDFRDPKIWRDEEGYHAVVANLCTEENGMILLYDSEDAQHWRYIGVLAAGQGDYGTMWECPDFFSLDGKAVLLHSAHEMKNEGLEFHPGDGTVCHIGRYDRENRRLQDEHVQTIDYGLDFYAPQTVESSDGRRIMIGWMQSWASSRVGHPDLPFFGQMTVPRELHAFSISGCTSSRCGSWSHAAAIWSDTKTCLSAPGSVCRACQAVCWICSFVCAGLTAASVSAWRRARACTRSFPSFPKRVFCAWTGLTAASRMTWCMYGSCRCRFITASCACAS